MEGYIRPIPVETVISRIHKPRVGFYDNNFLANPLIDELLERLGEVRVNAERPRYERQSGFDGRLLQARPEFNGGGNNNIAWNHNGIDMYCTGHSDRHHLASEVIGHCGECLRREPSLIERALEQHRALREKRGLPPEIPQSGGVVCSECGNHCRLDEGEIGFCGMYRCQNGRIVERFPGQAVVSWYFDPLPTNCVADWICPVSKSHRRSLQSVRLKNLAVFYGSCNSDCFFCQNDSFKEMMREGRPRMSPEELVNVIDTDTACICYFGGDPACNMRHSLETAELAVEHGDVIVCYETNGNISMKWLNPMADVVIRSGGTIKFDLKAYTPSIYTALTGVRNDVVLRNFKRLASISSKHEGKFLVASILLVPGYVDDYEIRRLVELIAECDPTIPTAFLGFAPHHHMRDLPRTSHRHAYHARDIAIEAGLVDVNIGNVSLLSNEEYYIG